jgi:RND family efflux transporter MFP subunit
VELLQSEASALEAELGRLAQERRNLQATLKIAKEDLDLVKAEYDRTLSLGTRKVVSQKELDQGRQKWLLSSQRAQEIKNSLALIKPRMDVLKAQRQSIKVRLKQADLALKRTEIRTPFVCRIADKLVETGQYVKVGSVLANIYNVGLMEVEVRIPPRDLRWLEIGPSGRPDRLKNPQVRARVMYDSSGENLVWDGLVSRVKGRMEENTRTLPIVVEVRNSHPGPGHPILPGMFVKVKIIGQKMHDLFLLPAGAVREGGAVYVVRNGKIEVKSVKILRRVGNQVYVTRGLSDGDQVITLFPGTALEGMKVRVRNRRTQPQKH